MDHLTSNETPQGAVDAIVESIEALAEVRNLKLEVTAQFDQNVDNMAVVVVHINL